MITVNRADGVLEIVIDNPPVNALAAPVRQGMAAALAEARNDANIGAVLIRGTGKGFSGGADVKEFEHTAIHPRLPEIFDQIEAMPKPVVAAIQGFALGGGLELALACHYRVATARAKLGQPEIDFGFIPGAGGTQRLPRLVGIERALQMILTGKPISGAEAAKVGLIDKLAEPDDLRQAAIALIGEKGEPRPTGKFPLADGEEAIDTFLSDNPRIIGGRDAARASVEAVRNATKMPLAQGLEKENVLFQQLVRGPQSKALRHVFFAERAANKIDALPEGAQPRAVESIGIVGAGTMGCGIAMNFLSIGLPVTIVETTAEALGRGVAIIRKTYAASVAKGRLSQEQADGAIALMTPSLEFGDLADRDLVIEAVYENMELKKDIFRRLDAIAKPGAILASNTSYLDIDEIAGATRRPADVLGMHFFSPANIMKLLEVVRGDATSPEALLTVVETGRRIAKVPVISGVCHGFIGNRMLTPRQTNAVQLVLEGADPTRIDRIHTDFGMPMGPFQMADLAGLDIGWHRDPARIETLKEAFCANGRFGLKSGAGYYDYPDGRLATPSPTAAALIDNFRISSGVERREIDDEEIIARTLYVMINEGFKILDEGIAQRSSDIDAVWVHGYGWPRHTGGPMYWAEQIGLDHISEAMRRYQDRLGPGFTLAECLQASLPASA